MKKSLSAFLVFTLVLTAMAGITITGSASELYGGGDGISGSPYIILNEVHFNNIRVNPGAEFEVRNDIDLTKLSASYVPFEFKGNLYGSVKVMNNLWEIKVNISSTVVNTGLFTKVVGDSAQVPAMISWLQLSGTVSGVNYTGGFAGDMGTYTTISNCVNRATIKGSNGTGGIVGKGSAFSSEIKYCINYAPVGGNSQVGGILGQGSTALNYCANHGSVTSASSDLGGIVGYQQGNISNCFNVGAVSANASDANKTNAGGISGRIATASKKIENCYNAGTINSKIMAAGILPTGTVAVAIKNCYNIGILSSTADIAPISNLATATITKSFYLSQTSGTGTEDPMPLTADKMKLQASFEGENGFDFETVWQMIPDSGYFYPQLRGNLHPAAVRGETREFPFLISSQEDFEIIKNNPGKYYAITKDIVLSQDYEPFAFSGVLFGEGNQLRTIEVSIGDALNPADYMGLFSTANDLFVLQYLRLTGTVQGKGWTGGFIGRVSSAATGSAIEYCVNEANITGIGSNVGGIAGGATLSAIKLNELTNKGKISGASNVGGLFGTSTNITLSKNLGEVTGSGDNVGGLVGFSYGAVTTSYNSGNVSGNNAVAGIAGLLGSNSRAYTASYNTGDITSKTEGGAGAIIGSPGGKTGNSIKYCYNIGTINGQGIYYPLSMSSAIPAENCYYLSYSEEDDGIDETKTISEMAQLNISADFIKSTNPNFSFPEISGNPQENEVLFHLITASAPTGIQVMPSGTIYVKKGTTVTYTILADTQYMINGITLNSAEISILNNTQGGQYTTPAIQEDKVLTVSATSFVFPDEIQSDAIARQSIYVPNQYEPITIEDKEITTPYGISFARVNDFMEYSLLEYGMLFSKENPNLDMNNHDHMVPAEKRNGYGQFGILFYGTGIKPETTYHTRAYAIYEKDGQEYIILGNPIQFTTAQ